MAAIAAKTIVHKLGAVTTLQIRLRAISISTVPIPYPRIEPAHSRTDGFSPSSAIESSGTVPVRVLAVVHKAVIKARPTSNPNTLKAASLVPATAA